MRKTVLPLVTLLISGLMGLTLLAPWIPPRMFWPSLFAAYGFVYLLPLLILLLIYWVRPPHPWALLPLVLILFSLPALDRHISLRIGSTEYPDQALVIATFNTHALQQLRVSPKGGSRVDREKTVQLFPPDMQPDLVCLQEVPLNYQPRGPDWGISNSYLFRHKNSLLVSRYPIREKGKKSFELSGNSVAWADIATTLGMIRVFNVHLQSNRISQDADQLVNAPIDDARTWTGWRAVLRKVRASTRMREEQATWLADAIRNSPYPTLVAGDFNDTPQSYTYRMIRHGLHDSFEHGGMGFGTTFAGRIPGLRIDFILSSTDLQFSDHRVAPVRMSDHYPVLARVALAK